MSNIFSKSESTRLQSVTTQVSPKHLEAEHGRISATKVTSVNLIYDTNILTLACETQYWWWKPSINLNLMVFGQVATFKNMSIVFYLRN